MRRAPLALVLVLVAGCGGGDDPRLVVSAASSLSEALSACSRDFEGAEVRLSFGGSDELAGQIRQGVKPDVYAAANASLPRALHADGLLARPVEFAANELVVAVPRDSDVDEAADLRRDGTRLAIGSESVPIGDYTRDALGRLPAGEGELILANVRSNEPDVRGIVGKLAQGAADAGFVYASDVRAVADRLRAVRLPPVAAPEVTYAAGVVTGAEEPELARRYLDGLLEGACADALGEAGFARP